MHVRRLGTSSLDLMRHGGDLLLALACGMADPQAVRTLERVFVPQLDRHLARSGYDDTARQDVFQEMLLRLCTGATPRILTYAGRASLSSWLYVAATRFALNQCAPTERKEQIPFDSNWEHLIVENCDIERRLAIEKVRPIFQEALGEALSDLSSRDRTLLRLCYLDGLSVDAIGKMYRVHRATAARWIVDIRKRLLADIQKRLSPGLQASEFESLASLLRSELHLSLGRLLTAV